MTPSQDWNTLVGLSAVNVKSIFMNHTLVSGDQRTVSGVISPQVFPRAPCRRQDTSSRPRRSTRTADAP